MLAEVDMEVEDESLDKGAEFNKGDSMAGVVSDVLKSDSDALDCGSHVDMSISAVAGSIISIVGSASGNEGSSGEISSKKPKTELTLSGLVRSVGGEGDVDPGIVVAV